MGHPDHQMHERDQEFGVRWWRWEAGEVDLQITLYCTLLCLVGRCAIMAQEDAASKAGICVESEICSLAFDSE